MINKNIQKEYVMNRWNYFLSRTQVYANRQDIDNVLYENLPLNKIDILKEDPEFYFSKGEFKKLKEIKQQTLAQRINSEDKNDELNFINKKRKKTSIWWKFTANNFGNLSVVNHIKYLDKYNQNSKMEPKIEDKLFQLRVKLNKQLNLELKERIKRKRIKEKLSKRFTKGYIDEMFAPKTNKQLNKKLTIKEFYPGKLRQKMRDYKKDSKKRISTNKNRKTLHSIHEIENQESTYNSKVNSRNNTDNLRLTHGTSYKSFKSINIHKSTNSLEKSSVSFLNTNEDNTTSNQLKTNSTNDNINKPRKRKINFKILIENNNRHIIKDIHSYTDNKPTFRTKTGVSSFLENFKEALIKQQNSTKSKSNYYTRKKTKVMTKRSNSTVSTVKSIYSKKSIGSNKLGLVKKNSCFNNSIKNFDIKTLFSQLNTNESLKSNSSGLDYDKQNDNNDKELKDKIKNVFGSFLNINKQLNSISNLPDKFNNSDSEVDSENLFYKVNKKTIMTKIKANNIKKEKKARDIKSNYTIKVAEDLYINRAKELLKRNYMKSKKNIFE